MKPKERIRQYQSSRLFLRKNDHRECIANDIYHNAIWMTKQQDDKFIDDAVWIKYPERALIGTFKRNNVTYMGNTNINFCDSHYVQVETNQRTFSVKKMQDCTIAISSYGSSSIWLTEDGVVWKKVGYNGGSPSVNDPFPYANNFDVVGANCIGNASFSLIDTKTRTYDLNTFVIQFIKDEETKEWSTQVFRQSRRFVFYEILGNMYPSTINFCGLTQSRAIFMNQFTKVGYSDTPDVTFVWSMDNEGNVEQVGTIPLSKAYDTNGKLVDGDYSRFATNPTKTVSCRVFVGRQGTNNRWVYNVLVHTTSDGGATWNGQLIKDIHDSGYYGRSIAEFRCDLCYRDGEFHLYFADYNGITYHWTSYDGETWEEKFLGDYVDVTVEGAFGSCVMQEPFYEKVRIKFNNNSDADSSTYPNLAFSTAIGQIPSGGMNRKQFDEGNHNITFINGLPHMTSMEDYLCCQIGNYIVFFKDCNLYYNADSWAIELRNYDEYNGVELVLPEDYCCSDGGSKKDEND